jgi:hypothetical protein
MKIRAKFICNTVTRDAAPNEIVRLSPAYGDENKDWSKWTPAGAIELTLSEGAAQGAFVPGKSYFVDFTPA